MTKTKCAFVLLAAILISSVLYAATWVEAEGVVHSKSFVIFVIKDENGNIVGSEGFDTLKIVRSDGSKVNGDCRYVEEVCDNAQVNDPISGTLKITNGWGSWTRLEL